MTKLTRTVRISVLAAPLALGCAQAPQTLLPQDYAGDAKAAMSMAAPEEAATAPDITASNPGIIARGSDPASSSSATAKAAKAEPSSGEIKLLSSQQPAAALPDGPLNLEYFENLADQVNPTLRRDRAAIDAAVGGAVQAGFWSNPQFSGNNPYVFNGRSTVMNYGFQQEIPVLGKKRLDEAAANENTRQAELSYKQDRLAMLAQVRQQFYQVLIDQRRVEVLTELTDVVLKSYEAYQKKQRAGDVATTDVLLLKIDYDTNRAKLENAKRILEGDRKQLEALVGAPGCVKGTLVGRITGPYPVFDEKAMLEFVTHGHTQIKAGQSQVQQNRLLLKRAEIDPYPNPTVGPAYQSGLTPGSDQFWLNMSFTIPVLHQNQGAIRQARANVSVAVESIDATRLNLVNQVANLYSQYLAAKETVDRFESDIMKAAAEATRLVKSGFAVGVVDFNTFLTAQRTAVQANSDYLDALQALWTNATQLSGVLQLERFP